MLMEFGKKLDNIQYTDRYSVYALIFNEEGKLATTYVKRKDAYFLPGGGIEQDEDGIQCVKRECWEEIGKEIDVKDYFCRTVAYEQNERLKADLKVIGDFYFAEITGDSRQLADISHELQWLEPQKAIARLTLENQAWVVQNIFENQSIVKRSNNRD